MPNKIFFLLVLFFLTTTFSFAETLSEISRQWLVLSNTGKLNLSDTQKNDFQLIAHYKNLSIVRAHALDADSALKQLKSLPGIIAVQRDYPIHFAKKKKPKRKIAEVHENAVAPSNKPGANEPVANCGLEEACKDSAKYWASDAVDADLMHYKMLNMGVGVNSNAHVAVVDSGFDKAQEKNMEVIGQVVTKPAAEFEDLHPITGKKLPGISKNFFLGNPTKDESGHGTMVSSVIAGKDKLGIAKNVSLSVYRVTPPGNAGSTSSAILDTAIYRACEENQDPDGVTIVNVSWGGRLDETGQKPEEKDEVTSKLIEQFAAKGCLIVKAAGNDNFRSKREMDLKDPYLRVASIDPSRELSYFSTQGEVSAPGSSLYVLESTTAYPKADKDKRCDKADESSVSPRRIVSGTSFAAPMAAAIASQVVRVLKSKPAFKNLKAKERIQLLNTILKASETQNAINGLSAVTIAERWMDLSPQDQTEALTDDGVVFLRNLLIEKQDPVCDKPAGTCREQKHCDYLISCINLSRAKLILCLPPKEKFLAEDLALTGYREKAFHFGYRYANLAVAQAEDPKKKVQLRKVSVDNFLEKLSLPTEFNVDDKFWKHTPHVDPNFTRMVIAPYLASELEAREPGQVGSTKLFENLLRLVLYSDKIKNSLEYGYDPVSKEDRGSIETLKTIQDILKSSKQLIGEDRYRQVLSDYVARFNDNTSKDYRERKNAEYLENISPEPLSVSAVRIINAAIDMEPNSSTLKKSFLDLESNIFSKMRELNQYYGVRTERNPTLSETYPTRSTLDPMLSRHTDRIVSAINQHSVASLSPVEVQYALEHLDTLSVTDKACFLFEVLDCVARDFGWGDKNNRDITGSAMQQLQLLWPSLKDKELRNVENRFALLIDQASNVYFVGQLLTSWERDYPYTKDPVDILFSYVDTKDDIKKGLTYKKSPLLTEENLALLKLKIAAFIARMTEKEAKNISSEWIVARATMFAFEGVWSEKISRENSFVVPRAPSQRTNRLEPIQLEVDRMKVSDRAKLFEEYLSAVAKGSKSSDHPTARFFWDLMQSNVPFDVTLRNDVRNQAVYRTMKKNDSWVSHLKSLTGKGDPIFDSSAKRLLDILYYY